MTGPWNNPTPEEVKAARLRLGYTQAQAAAVIYCGYRAWAEWEGSNRKMHPTMWWAWNVRVAMIAKGIDPDTGWSTLF